MSKPDLRQVLSKLDDIRADVLAALRTPKHDEIAIISNNVHKVVKQVFKLARNSPSQIKKDALDCKLYFIHVYTNSTPHFICTLLDIDIKPDTVYRKICRIRSIKEQPRIDIVLSEKILLIENKIKTLS